VREGRAFAATDLPGSEPVAIVNRTLAEREYEGHAVGARIVVNDYSGYATDRALAGDPTLRPVTARIVGVVGDTRQFGPLDARKREFVYLPAAQAPEHIAMVLRLHPLRFALRVRGDPDHYRQAVQAAVAGVAPDQPIANLSTMEAVVRATTDDTRRNLFLIGLFALLALGLAAAGMYAVMALAVTGRRHEFGVRMALGGRPRSMVGLVLRGGLRQIVIGLLLGTAITLALSRVLGAVLEEMGRSVFDPLALAGVCVALALAGLLACLVPALRAARVPPMHALRGE
jgi:hypothetical protein